MNQHKRAQQVEIDWCVHAPQMRFSRTWKLGWVDYYGDDVGLAVQFSEEARRGYDAWASELSKVLPVNVEPIEIGGYDVSGIARRFDKHASEKERLEIAVLPPAVYTAIALKHGDLIKAVGTFETERTASYQKSFVIWKGSKRGDFPLPRDYHDAACTHWKNAKLALVDKWSTSGGILLRKHVLEKCGYDIYAEERVTRGLTMFEHQHVTVMSKVLDGHADVGAVWSAIYVDTKLAVEKLDKEELPERLPVDVIVRRAELDGASEFDRAILDGPELRRAAEQFLQHFPGLKSVTRKNDDDLQFLRDILSKPPYASATGLPSAARATPKATGL